MDSTFVPKSFQYATRTYAIIMASAPEHLKETHEEWQLFEGMLNAYGMQGWELIQVVRDPMDHQNDLYLFKKEVPCVSPKMVARIGGTSTFICEPKEEKPFFRDPDPRDQNQGIE